MKRLLLATLLTANLAACSNNSIPNQSVMPGNQPSAEDIHEEVISRPKELETKNITIAKPGVAPVGIVNVLTDLLIDGDVSSASLKKRGPVDVWLDDTDVVPPAPLYKEITVPDTFQMP